MELSPPLARIISSQRIAAFRMFQIDSSDNELLQSIIGGEEAALTTLYRRHQGHVYRFALQMSGSVALAEDVTQDVFMTLIDNIEIYDPRRGPLQSFLLGVARNQTLSRLRREQFYVPLEEETPVTESLPESSAGPLEALASAETVEAVRRAVLSLPERYREVVVLCDLQELSYAETAAVLGCAVGTVRSRLHRARGLLLEKLQPNRKPSAEINAPDSARCFA